jgi:hypothetical protein
VAAIPASVCLVEDLPTPFMTTRPSKRQRTYHDRVELADDFEIVHARETYLKRNGRVAVETPRSPQKGRTTWTVGESWAPEDSLEFALDPHGDWYDEQLDAPVTETIEVRLQPIRSKAKKKSKISVSLSPIINAYFADFASKRRPHVFWKENYRSSYLDELIRWEGRGDMMDEKLCRDCVARGVQAPRAPVYRCLDCFLPDLTCQDCCIRRHRLQPLHVIEVRSSREVLARLLTACFSNGVAPFSAKCRYNRSVYVSSSVM